MAQPATSTAVFCAKRRRYGVVLLLWASVFVPVSQAAVAADWLYTVQEAVLDQSEESRQRAAREALLQVLSRVTGLSTIPRNPQIAAALERSDRFYSEYVFVRPTVRVVSARD